MEVKRIAKWGFGMAPISTRMQSRYDNAVQNTLDLLECNLRADEAPLDSLNELKGMFNRCVREDQWDWFSVYTELGHPPKANMRKIVASLSVLRRAIRERDDIAAAAANRLLLDANILHNLYTYQNSFQEWAAKPGDGWIYILSTREQPEILKIGMTSRSVAQRVREINSATGVLVPFAARRVFRAKDAQAAERAVFDKLTPYRLRPDREFFCLKLAAAEKVVEECLHESSMRFRLTGTVKWFDTGKSYGFVTAPVLGDIFLHISQVPREQLPLLLPGTIVEFDLGRRLPGLCALNISLSSGQKPVESHASRSA